MGHKHQTTDATRIKRLVDDGIAVTTLAKEFGVSKEAISGWLKANAAPYWTRCACEALERRRGKSNRKYVICEIPNHFTETLLAVVKSVDGEAHVIGVK